MSQKRDNTRQAWLALALLLSATGAAATVGIVPRAARPPQQPQAARQAIEDGGGRWVLAWRTHNAAQMAALFAADGLEMGRGGVVTRGRAAVAARFARLFGAVGPVQATRQTIDVWLAGNAAYEAGRYTFTFPAARPGQKASIMAGNYVTVWQKQKDGRWLIHSDVAVSLQ